jgi:hypothetical protein
MLRSSPETKADREQGRISSALCSSRWRCRGDRGNWRVVISVRAADERDIEGCVRVLEQLPDYFTGTPSPGLTQNQVSTKPGQPQSAPALQNRRSGQGEECGRSAGRRESCPRTTLRRRNAGAARAGSVTPGGLAFEWMSEGIRGGGSSWRPKVSVAGRGTVFERSIDDVDILRWLLGPVATVSATTRAIHGQGIDDSSGSGRARYWSPYSRERRLTLDRLSRYRPSSSGRRRRPGAPNGGPAGARGATPTEPPSP